MRGFFISGAVGVLVGLLLAPTKGAELRQLLKEFFGKVRQDGGQALNETVEAGRTLVSNAVEAGNELTDEARERLHNASHRLERASDIAADSVRELKDEMSDIVKDNSSSGSA